MSGAPVDPVEAALAERARDLGLPRGRVVSSAELPLLDGVVRLGELRWQTREDAAGRLEVVARRDAALAVVVDAGALARLARLWIDDALELEAAGAR